MEHPNQSNLQSPKAPLTIPRAFQAMAEFELIKRYFSELGIVRDDVALGIGDDCALLDVPDGFQLAVSMDTLVAGVHFPHDTDAADIGFKALAVSLSDLAAMGATPAWATLGLTLPAADENWLKRFCEGFSAIAQRYQVQLIGGDTTRGPLSITLQIHGFVKTGQALRRDQAQTGDWIYVSGTLGDAALGLRLHQGKFSSVKNANHCIDRLNRPEPRIELGLALAGLSRCAIDLSDGLLADLNHVVNASGCGAEIELANIPLSPEFKSIFKTDVDWILPLASGDDYELCFTVSPENKPQLETLGKQLNLPLSCIGRIVPGTGILIRDQNGHQYQPVHLGYEHF